jgi:ribosomal protein S27E
MMVENKSSFRYWVVNCLGCKNPIPLFAEAIDAASSPAAGGIISERSFFRAWCMDCGREYPYLSEAMIGTDEPPKDKHNRQVEFSRFRQRIQVKRAHA